MWNGLRIMVSRPSYMLTRTSIKTAAPYTLISL